MTRKFFAFTLALIFVMNAAIFADTKTKKDSTVPLAASLPASDGVISVDVQKLLNVALVEILATNPQKLQEFNVALDELKTKTGLDLRQFEQLAVGVNIGQKDVAPMILARGKYSSAALLSLIKIAAKDKIREEKIADKTAYVFSLKEIAADNQANIANNKTAAKIFDMLLRNVSGEIAVTAFDAKTLAFGTVERVRETFEKKSKISNSVLGFVTRKPNAIITFGANTPTGLSPFLNLDTDEFGETLASVKQIFGSMDIAGGNALVSLNAKAANAEQAENLFMTLETLQQIGKNLLGGMKGDDKKVYAKMAEKIQMAKTGTVISMDLQMPQADIGALLATF